MNTLIQTMREKYIEKGEDCIPSILTHPLVLVIALTKTIRIMETIICGFVGFSFLSVCVTIIFTWLIIVIHTDRRQTTLGVEHKTSKNNHSCCLLAISVENYFTWRSQLSIFNVDFTYQMQLLILRYILRESPKVHEIKENLRM